MPSASSIGSALSDQTGLICCVHLLGGGADMEQLAAHAQSAGAVLIEDSCEALGTTIHGKQTGTIARVGSYSFFFSHHITTGEGGMVVTDDDELGDVLRVMRAHGWARDSKRRRQFESENPNIDPRFLFITSGYNLRPTEMAAAIGRVQLKRLDRFNQERREFANLILSHVRDLDQIHVPRVPEWLGHTWYGLPLVLKADFNRSREEVVRALAQKGIETRPIVAGNMAAQPAFRFFKSRQVALPNAELVMSRGIYLGVNPGMGVDVANYVGEALRQALR
jgi:CDP-6-deoxy-D-xylo-4-hexulose-3-dehydrase